MPRQLIKDIFRRIFFFVAVVILWDGFGVKLLWSARIKSGSDVAAAFEVGFATALVIILGLAFSMRPILKVARLCIEELSKEDGE